MAGHSKFKNIQYRKGSQDKKRSKLFAKITKEITVAAKLGMLDPESNPRLRSAISTARSQNMPKDNIERAIKKSSDENAETYDEVRYEGFGPSGVGIIIETLTDNRNRTAGDIRSIFSKWGGNLGETGSVSFMFNHYGKINVPSEEIDFEKIFDISLEAGATDCDISEDIYEVSCSSDDLHNIAYIIEEKINLPVKTQLSWKPLNIVNVDKESAHKVIDMVNSLDDHDDVQEVFSNFDIPEELFEELK
tara:strand:+ start:840 stop:1583 length:744 start_codon:yes stop_codon:yes gene_type:complete